MIRDSLGISKSTLSNWLTLIPYKPNKDVFERVGKAKLKSAFSKQRTKFKMLRDVKVEARKEITKLSKRDLFFFGLGIYLGEGGKSFENVLIVNADPKVIQLSIRWLKEIGGAKMTNFKPYLHLYPDNNVDDALEYWSHITRIPIAQFGKTTIDTRKNKLAIKKSKLPHGTLHLHLKSNGVPFLGVRLHRKIMAWIERALSYVT